MPENLVTSRSRTGPRRPSFLDKVLDPTDSVGEVLFGVIMALTITLGAGVVVKGGDAATKEILIGIVGCNAAWGLIDAAMHLMALLLDRSRRLRLYNAIRAAASVAEARAWIGDELDERLDPITTAADREKLYTQIHERIRKAPVEKLRLTKSDFLGALAVFWLVFLTTIPAVAPFLFLDDRFTALRVSNALLLALLFVAGVRWARAAGANPWFVGSMLVLFGLVLVAVAVALGG
jgi:VIT1/CCC1 family predicted Fe2+/Mn2+ transporter